MSTVPESSVPKLRFSVFDSVYRQLYTTLAITLMLDPKVSLHIMALWLWMEKSGFIDTVEKIHNLPLDLISGLADEAVVCINFFKNVIFPTSLELRNSIPLLHFLLKKDLTLMFVSRNRGCVIRGMKKVQNDLSQDFEELYREAKWTHEMSQIIRSFNDNVNVDNVAVGSNLSQIGFDRLESSYLSPSHLSSPPCNAGGIGHDPIKVVLPGSPVSPHGFIGMGRSNMGGAALSQIQPFSKMCESPVQVPATHKPDDCSFSRLKLFSYKSTPCGHSLSSQSRMIPRVCPQHLLIRDTSVVIPAEDRTLFVTFSKGYRVHEPELMKYMTDWLGDCVEAIIMQESLRDEQPLYARIVFHYPETIDVILKGKERYKFSINGKHVWVRKYIPKNQRK